MWFPGQVVGKSTASCNRATASKTRRANTLQKHRRHGIRTERVQTGSRVGSKQWPRPYRRALVGVVDRGQDGIALSHPTRRCPPHARPATGSAAAVEGALPAVARTSSRRPGPARAQEGGARGRPPGVCGVCPPHGVQGRSPGLNAMPPAQRLRVDAIAGDGQRLQVLQRYILPLPQREKDTTRWFPSRALPSRDRRALVATAARGEGGISLSPPICQPPLGFSTLSLAAQGRTGPPHTRTLGERDTGG
jgi:hypothetical protein